MILKLPRELSSRNFLGRITGRIAQRRQCSSSSITSSPWYLFDHLRTCACVTAFDPSGHPRGLFEDSWVPTSKHTSIVSSSCGLFLMHNQGASGDLFTVVNPLTKLSRELPPLKLDESEESMISYSKILCSKDDESYRVFTMGVMTSDKENGILYNFKFRNTPNSGMPHLDDINEYMKPFMHVYCSNSHSWTTITTGFPREFRLPYRIFSKPHQSFIDQENTLYCVTNSDNMPKYADRIARLNTGTMEWNPVQVPIPDHLLLHCMMVDHHGKLLLVVSEKGIMKFNRAEIRGDELVMGKEILIPHELLPENGQMFGMMDMWGYGEFLVLHVPKLHEIEKEPRVRSWFFNLMNSTFCEVVVGEPFPLGDYMCADVDLLRMVYVPSNRLP